MKGLDLGVETHALALLVPTEMRRRVLTLTESRDLPVLYEAKDRVGWITLNRAPVLNAVNSDLVTSLAE